jgi:hypothetical protein
LNYQGFHNAILNRYHEVCRSCVVIITQ